MGLSIRFEFNVHIYRGSRINNEMESPKAKINIKTVPLKDCKDKRSFFKAVEDEIIKLEASRSVSTISNFRCVLKSLKRFLNRDIAISEIDSCMLESYDKWLRDNDVCLNSISCYMRSLRSLMSKICGEESRQMFRNVFTGRTKTDKRAIPESYISRIKAMSLKKGSFLSLARDVFLFSFYALGMPFVDICFLRKSQISDGQLSYERHKTGQKVVVCLEPCMTEIINRYQRKDSDYVFPLLQSTEPKEAYRQYLSRLSSYNKALIRLAQLAGIASRLTSYTPRHTWASVAYNSNIDLPVISKALGHANPQTTLTYIKEINDDRLVEANHTIMSRIAKLNNN